MNVISIVQIFNQVLTRWTLTQHRQILVIHWCKRGTRQQFSSFSTDTQSLLGGTQTPAEDNAVMKRQRKQQVHLSAQTKVMF